MKAAARLTDLPNIGPAIAGDLEAAGIHTPDQLRRRDPLELFRALAPVMGHRHDPCVLYTLLAVRQYLEGGPPVPWWTCTDEGKRLLAGDRGGKGK